MALLKAKFGVNHRETLQAMTNLASAYERGSRLADAIRLHEEALALKRANLGADDPDTLASLHALAEPYRRVGRLPGGDRRARGGRAPPHGHARPGSPRDPRMHEHCATMFVTAGRFDEAIGIFEKVLPPMKAKLGPAHSSTFQTMYSLGEAYLGAGRPDDALRVREETCEFFEAKYGRNDADSLYRRFELAMTYEDANRLPDAIRICREALSRSRASLGPAKHATLDGTFLLARLFLKSNQPDDARPLFVEYLAGVRNIYGGDDPYYAQRLAVVGKALLEQRLFAEAEARLRESLADPGRKAAGRLDHIPDAVAPGRSAGRTGPEHPEAEPLLPGRL